MKKKIVKIVSRSILAATGLAVLVTLASIVSGQPTPSGAGQTYTPSGGSPVFVGPTKISSGTPTFIIDGNGTAKFRIYHGTTLVSSMDSSGNLTAASFVGSGASLTAGSVDTGRLGTDSVTAVKIAAAAVETAKIGNDAVTTIKIMTGAVDTARLATDSVTSIKIMAGAVDTNKISDGAVTASKIAASGATPGSCGDSTHICIPTIDAGGRITTYTTAVVGGGVSPWIGSGANIYFTGGNVGMGNETAPSGAPVVVKSTSTSANALALDDSVGVRVVKFSMDRDIYASTVAMISGHLSYGNPTFQHTIMHLAGPMTSGSSANQKILFMEPSFTGGNAGSNHHNNKFIQIVTGMTDGTFANVVQQPFNIDGRGAIGVGTALPIASVHISSAGPFKFWNPTNNGANLQNIGLYFDGDMRYPWKIGLSSGSYDNGNAGDGVGLKIGAPASQTIAGGDTIQANACGTYKPISSAGSVTTNTSNTFSAPSADNAGCCMDVINVGANDITLDANTNFASAGAANVTLGTLDTARVCSTGASGKWYQIGATGNN